ncbi:MAG: hypothetical protein ACJ8LG_11130 [Massilia sp.]
MIGMQQDLAALIERALFFGRPHLAFHGTRLQAIAVHSGAGPHNSD